MMLQIELWHVVLFLLAVLGGFWTAAKLLGTQWQRSLDARFTAQDKALDANHKAVSARLDGIESVNRADAAQWQRVERELLNLKAELPLHYVRRDDFVQAIGNLSTRIDNFALRMERALDNRKGEHL